MIDGKVTAIGIREGDYGMLAFHGKRSSVVNGVPARMWRIPSAELSFSLDDLPSVSRRGRPVKSENQRRQDSGGGLGVPQLT
jgi:hypothetical protein